MIPGVDVRLCLHIQSVMCHGHFNFALVVIHIHVRCAFNAICGLALALVWRLYANFHNAQRKLEPGNANKAN
jgi:hypothetical protein